jgi:diguanylate cyclase (GGDEF)-like protein
MSLQLKTLYLISVTNCFVAGGSFALSWAYHRDLPGLRGWAVGLGLCGLGLLLLGLGGPATDQITQIVAYGLIVSGYTAVWISVGRFNTGSRAVGRAVIVVAGFCGLSALTWALGIAAQVDAIIVSIFLGGISLMASWQVAIGARVEPLRSRMPTAAVFAVMGLVFVARAADAAINGNVGAPQALAAANMRDAWAMFGATACIITLNLGMLMMANERLRKRDEHLASIDSLTGLMNRRSFLEKADRIVARAATDGEPVSVLLFDIDNFRDINRRCGHDGGDEALRRLAGFLGQRMRPTDLVARYGGEEFCALLRGADHDQAQLIANRLCKDIAQLPITAGGKPLSLTVSIGVALVEMGDLRAAISDADGALYRAKEMGRNQVRAA